MYVMCPRLLNLQIGNSYPITLHSGINSASIYVRDLIISLIHSLGHSMYALPNDDEPKGSNSTELLSWVNFHKG